MDINMRNKQQDKNSVYYDQDSDVLFFGIKKGMEEEFVEVAPGINVELDENSQVIGVEILNASKILQHISTYSSRGKQRIATTH
jgi:uncharacterized protein YuzE